MNSLEMLKLALANLRAGGLRSLLSVLGIVIGVGSVITLVSVGEGARNQVTSQLTSLGTNLLTVTPAVRLGTAGRLSSQATVDLTLDMADELVEATPAVVAATPVLQLSGRIVYGSANLTAPVLGVDESYDALLHYRPLIGRFLEPRDGAQARMAAVLGYEVAVNLFGSESPVGQRISLVTGGRTIPAIVVGVMERKGSMLFSNFDRQVYVPAESLVARGLASRRVPTYLVQGKEGVPVQEAVDQLDFFFARRLGSADLVQVSSQQALVDALAQTTGTLTLLLAAIAGVSLVVGGIGIMNVMLVSVVERTHEIGVRMAIGARRRHVALQFLAESTMLCLVGGVVGLGAGWAGGYGLSHLLKFPFTLSVWPVVIAIGFSMAVGILFGWYPARRASRLDPVEALRYE